jgi:hypothetical protein
MNHAEMQEIMTKLPHEIVSLNGEAMTAQRAIERILKGEDVATIQAPHPQPAPGAPTGGGVIPSQGALDKLTPDQFAELQREGGRVEGLTAPFRTRVRVEQVGTGVTVTNLTNKGEGEVAPAADPFKMEPVAGQRIVVRKITQG